jgi:hypothetical protein
MGEDPVSAGQAIREFVNADEPYELPGWTPLAAWVVGASVAVATGRKRTRFDNLIIGGTFTAFAAYRDPRATVAATLFVAAIEGAIWGITDRLVPSVKESLLPAERGAVVPA